MNAVSALMSGLIDYAGLFPPAELDMPGAVERYDEYLRGPDAASLGRFIVPSSRLDEMEAVAGNLLSRAGAGRWRIAVIAGENARAAVGRVLRFNAAHANNSNSLADTLEVMADSSASITAIAAEIPQSLSSYFEIPLDENLAASVAAIKKAGARAKIRTGGVGARAFPSATEVLCFLEACNAAGVAFKATAGLHHAVRAAYPLTYEANAESATMFGYLNIFLGAAFLHSGRPSATVMRILEESDASAFQLEDSFIAWRGERLDAKAISDVRRNFAVSFGSFPPMATTRALASPSAIRSSTCRRSTAVCFQATRRR